MPLFSQLFQDELKIIKSCGHCSKSMRRYNLKGHTEKVHPNKPLLEPEGGTQDLFSFVAKKRGLDEDKVNKNHKKYLSRKWI